MAEYEKKVREKLLQNGCRFVRHGKGDHDIYFSPITNKNFTVDSKMNEPRRRACGVSFVLLRNCTQV